MFLWWPGKDIEKPNIPWRPRLQLRASHICSFCYTTSVDSSGKGPNWGPWHLILRGPIGKTKKQRRSFGALVYCCGPQLPLLLLVECLNSPLRSAQSLVIPETLSIYRISPAFLTKFRPLLGQKVFLASFYCCLKCSCSRIFYIIF